MQKVKADRTGNFTVINNYHLHDRNISTSAKTLMTLMLSLPEDWEMSVKGIAKILAESEYAVRRMMKELEAGGYLKKEQRKDESGRYARVEYTIYELPQTETAEAPDPSEEPETPREETSQPETSQETQRPEGSGNDRENGAGKPLVEIPQAGKPYMGRPFAAAPRAEILTLQNTNNNKILNNNPIHPDPSPFRRANPPGADGQRKDNPQRQPQRSDGAGGTSAIPRKELYGRYRDLLMGNIGYDSLKISSPHELGMVDGLVELMLEVLCSTKPYIRISGTDHPRELVKARFLKLRCDHMLYILDSLRENTSEVRNVRQYLLAVLFNAPATIDGYYTLRVGHDLAAGWKEKTS